MHDYGCACHPQWNVTMTTLCSAHRPPVEESPVQPEPVPPVETTPPPVETTPPPADEAPQEPVTEAEPLADDLSTLDAAMMEIEASLHDMGEEGKAPPTARGEEELSEDESESEEEDDDEGRRF